MEYIYEVCSSKCEIAKYKLIKEHSDRYSVQDEKGCLLVKSKSNYKLCCFKTKYEAIEWKMGVLDFGVASKKGEWEKATNDRNEFLEYLKNEIN